MKLYIHISICYHLIESYLHNFEMPIAYCEKQSFIINSTNNFIQLSAFKCLIYNYKCLI
jgi:hypothetical protein